MEAKHFILKADGEIVEYAPETAADIAAGNRAVPEYADRELPYLQVWVDDEINDNELQVRTAGAVIRFNEEGRFAEAEAPDEEIAEDQNMRFAHDTCVQLAVRTRYPEAFTVH